MPLGARRQMLADHAAGWTEHEAALQELGGLEDEDTSLGEQEEYLPASGGEVEDDADALLFDDAMMASASQGSEGALAAAE